MKANEAPEKIWMTDEWFWQFDDKDFMGEDSVEYIRKDAFIEKAWDWVEDNILSSNQQDKSRLYFEQFKDYMKGE
jgi:hypothetical protein